MQTHGSIDWCQCGDRHPESRRMVRIHAHTHPSRQTTSGPKRWLLDRRKSHKTGSWGGNQFSNCVIIYCIFECLWERSAEGNRTVTYTTNKHPKIHKESDFYSHAICTFTHFLHQLNHEPKSILGQYHFWRATWEHEAVRDVGTYCLWLHTDDAFCICIWKRKYEIFHHWTFNCIDFFVHVKFHPNFDPL